jgi:type I restriction enzyme M protein
LDIRCALERPGHHKEGASALDRAFRRVEKSYSDDPNGRSRRRDTAAEGRFRKFHIAEIKERDHKLEITWLKDESLEDADELPEPQDLATEAITELEAAVDDLREIAAMLEASVS